MRNPRLFGHPLAIDAPQPLMEVPVKPARMIHFLDASNEKMVAKVPDMVKATDVLLGNLEDAIPADRKEAARDGLVKVAKETDLGSTALWTRVNSLESPWVLDDFLTLVPEIGDKLEVIMVPKVEGPWDIHYVDRLLAQLEAKAGLDRPILVHAILETALGVVQPRGDRHRVPADAGDELRARRPRRLAADEDDARRRRPPRLPDDRGPRRRRSGGAPAPYMQDPWHYSIARMVDACNSAGILPFYGPYGDIKDVKGCETQFRGCLPARLRRRLVPPPRPDRHREEGLLAGSGGGQVREEGPRGDSRRPRRPHDRRQDAGRRNMEAVQGDGHPRRAARRGGPGAEGGVRALRSARCRRFRRRRSRDRYHECDQQDLVFNGNYLTYVDRSAIKRCGTAMCLRIVPMTSRSRVAHRGPDTTGVTPNVRTARQRRCRT